MTKADIMRRLVEVADYNLLGAGTWPAHSEFVRTFSQALLEMGLSEPVLGSKTDRRATALGLEMKLHLMMVFAGVFSIWDAPEILEEHGLLSEEEVRDVWDQTSENGAELLIHKYVLRAYLEFCNRSRRLN